MAKTDLICGCGGEIGYDTVSTNNKWGYKFHIKYYCRKNCGLNFVFTRFLRTQKHTKLAQHCYQTPKRGSSRGGRHKDVYTVNLPYELSDKEYQRIGQGVFQESIIALKAATRTPIFINTNTWSGSGVLNFTEPCLGTATAGSGETYVYNV